MEKQQCELVGQKASNKPTRAWNRHTTSTACAAKETQDKDTKALAFYKEDTGSTQGD